MSDGAGVWIQAVRLHSLQFIALLIRKQSNGRRHLKKSGDVFVCYNDGRCGLLPVFNVWIKDDEGAVATGEVPYKEELSSPKYQCAPVGKNEGSSVTALVQDPCPASLLAYVLPDRLSTHHHQRCKIPELSSKRNFLIILNSRLQIFNISLLYIRSDKIYSNINGLYNFTWSSFHTILPLTFHYPV